MELPHNYITRIEINGLWNMYNLTWNLNNEVNILSGLNGSGKSTILHALSHIFKSKRLSTESAKRIKSIVIYFENGDIISSEKQTNEKLKNINIISTFDNRLNDFEALQKLSDGSVRTELDWEIYQLQRRYMSYQLTQGKRAIALLSSGVSQNELCKINSHKELFFDIIDKLFSETHKTIDRNSDELTFISDHGAITPYMLSSGEKQILLILATVLTQNNEPSILLMDEPEISLHFDWQTTLIENIRALNPNVQLIVSTHSPALVMNGWIDRVSEISDLIIK